MKAVVLDTTVIVKALVPPRRKKKDELYHEYLGLHESAKSILSKVESKEVKLIIPSVALVETGAVISRLTGDEETAREAVSFLRANSSEVLYDYRILDHAVKAGIEIKASGFDTLFIASAEVSGATLITDDEQMFKVAVEYGVKAEFLRDKAKTKKKKN